MFEAAEIGQKLEKEEFTREADALRVGLVNAQYDLREADHSVLVVISGDDRPGATEVLNRLHEWMDVRYIDTCAFGPLTEAERLRPPFWRYWHSLPRHGRVGMFLAGWAQHPLAARLEGRLDEPAYDLLLGHFSRLQETLAEDGVVVVKYWIHLPKHAHRKRAEHAHKGKGRNHEHIDEMDLEISERYDEMAPLAEELLRRTESTTAPWHVVEGSDARYRDVTVARSLLSTMEQSVGRSPAAAAPEATPQPLASPGATVLDSVDLGAKLPYESYKKRLEELQEKLFTRVEESHQAGRRTMLAFEGWDAAGKGGVIRRITRALDARDYHVTRTAAPTEEERAHHYLWRFWRDVPAAGRTAIFDRTWYGRVLVERVEGFASEAEWRRAYTEINDFEAQLCEADSVLLKFWLHIDPDEQLRRFEARQKTDYKKYKITGEDYRNREKWDAYVLAVQDMVARTSTPAAPWHLVPANDKRFARVKVLETIVDALEKASKQKGT